MEASQANDFSAWPTLEELTKGLRPISTSPELWATRQRALPFGEIKVGQCKLGELRSLETVSRPDIRARLPRFALRANTPSGGDVYRNNDLVQTGKEGQGGAVLKEASTSHLITPARGVFDGRIGTSPRRTIATAYDVSRRMAGCRRWRSGL